MQTGIVRLGVFVLSISYKGSAERVRRPENRYVPQQRHSARGYQRRSPHTRALLAVMTGRGAAKGTKSGGR